MPASVVIQTTAPRMTATPATVNTLYRPVRAMNPAVPWMVRMMPTVMGTSSRPDTVADSPELICR